MSELIATLVTSDECPTKGAKLEQTAPYKLEFYNYAKFRFELEIFTNLKSAFFKFVYSKQALLRFAYGIFILDKS